MVDRIHPLQQERTLKILLITLLLSMCLNESTDMIGLMSDISDNDTKNGVNTYDSGWSQAPGFTTWTISS